MAEKYLIVIDMQNDFVDGALGTKEAQAIVPDVVKKVQEFNGTVVFTQDTHPEQYLQTQEGRLLPVAHCIRGSEGWKLIPVLQSFAAVKKCSVYEKETFGSVKLAEDLRQAAQKKMIDSITLIGLCTDICVVSNALLIKANLPEIPIFVDESCCAGVTPEKHEAALETMRSCQILTDKEKK